MELEININFTSAPEDHDFWQILCEGLCDNKQGAWLEEKMEYFGSQANQTLEKLLDDCEAFHGTAWFESYEHKGLEFSLVMVGGYGTEDCFPRIRELLSHCRVKNLTIQPMYEQ